MSERPAQQTITTEKHQRSEDMELPQMYESDHSLSSSESRDDGIVIPDPATLLNLKRSLAWSQDSEESKHSSMETDDGVITNFKASLSAKIDQTNITPQENDDKENGIRPIHWEQQLLTQQSFQSVHREFAI